MGGWLSVSLSLLSLLSACLRLHLVCVRVCLHTCVCVRACAGCVRGLNFPGLCFAHLKGKCYEAQLPGLSRRSRAMACYQRKRCVLKGCSPVAHGSCSKGLRYPPCIVNCSVIDQSMHVQMQRAREARLARFTEPNPNPKDS